MIAPKTISKMHPLFLYPKIGAVRRRLRVFSITNRIQKTLANTAWLWKHSSPLLIVFLKLLEGNNSPNGKVSPLQRIKSSCLDRVQKKCLRSQGLKEPCAFTFENTNGVCSSHSSYSN